MSSPLTSHQGLASQILSHKSLLVTKTFFFSWFVFCEYSTFLWFSGNTTFLWMLCFSMFCINDLRLDFRLDLKDAGLDLRLDLKDLRFAGVLTLATCTCQCIKVLCKFTYSVTSIGWAVFIVDCSRVKCFLWCFFFYFHLAFVVYRMFVFILLIYCLLCIVCMLC